MSHSGPRRVELTINGRLYVVEVEDPSASPLTVCVNGEPYRVELGGAPNKDKISTLNVAAPSAPDKPSRQDPVAPVMATSREVLAPMPGDILDITVTPGEQVTVGQQLCALEAMKMKSAIRSPREGIIKTVEVTEGQAVSHGDVLVTFK